MKIAIRSVTAMLAFVILMTSSAYAAPQQQASDDTAVPDPPSRETVAKDRLLNAKNVFVSNGGADPGFPADPGAGVVHFTNALRAWGRYNVVSSIKDADLIFELRSATTTSVVDGTFDEPTAGIYRTPFFRLTITDPATLKPIWPITVPATTGIRKKDKANLLKVSAENLTSQLKLLIGESLSSREAAELQQSVRYSTGHRSYIPLIVYGSVVVGSTVAGILTVRGFNNRAKQEQEDFCKISTFFCTP